MKSVLFLAAGLGVAAAVAGALIATGAISLKGRPVVERAEEEQFDLPAAISFNEHIQPILSANCYHCHGPDSSTRKGGLRLDREESAFAPAASGEPAIRKDDPAASPLLTRIFSANPAEVMPPPEAHIQLKPVEKEMLARWVKEGAKYEAHWAFIPPKQSAPSTKESDSWPRTPIDRFILAKLRELKLEPSGPEDPRTLIRRVSLDLTGLLPEANEVEAFAANPTDAAYEAYVDKLLASPHFGEHRAHYWLDYVRYADTHGLSYDNARSIWLYRDYVVKAFNTNMPFDQFIREQLAGDLIPRRTIDSLIATGYVRSAVTTSEGGTIPEELVVNLARDRTDALGSTFLGLSVSCAACHDHKFDPTTQRDFYRLTAFFNNISGVSWDENRTDPPPALRVPDADLRAKADAVLARSSAVREELRERRRKAPELFRQTMARGVRPQPVSTEGLELRLRLDEGKGDLVRNSAPEAVVKEFTADTSPLLWGETSWLWPGMRMNNASRLPLGKTADVEADTPFSAGGWIELRRMPNTDTGSGALFSRMESSEKTARRGWDLWQEEGKFAVNLVHEWPGKAIKVRTKDAFPRYLWTHVFFTYDGSRRADGVRIFINGKRVETETLHDTLEPGLTIRSEALTTHIGRRDNESPMLETRYQDMRFYRRALEAGEVARLPFEDVAAEIVAAEPDPGKWNADQRFVVLDRYFLEQVDQPSVAARKDLEKMDAEFKALTAKENETLIAEEQPRPAYADVLSRGVFNARAERVEPGTPSFLPPLPKDVTPDREALANWLVTAENPLTARVTVNRMWQEIYGRGLVETTDDFGIMGARPSHPALLDWLAVQFRESGWNTKALYRQLVLSSAYRQSSRVTPDRLEKDAANRYFSRAPRFRMDAEMLRDTALQTSGLLVDKLGGPPVKPYQPPGVWEAVAMPNSTTQKYAAGKGEDLYRRSLYTFWKRAAPPPGLETFDAPSREVACTRRMRTNTPLQALVTMNDPQFVEASRKMAERAIKAGQSSENRLDALARWTLARRLAEPERAVLLSSLQKFQAHFQASPDDARALLAVGESPADPSLDAVEVAEWTLVASQFYNLDEYLNK